MKKNLRKVKYCNYECEKQNRRIKITTNVSNNNINNNRIRYYKTLPAGTTITTTKISTKPKTKVNRTVIILKSMISAPSTSHPITTATKMLYDQLLNVINKIQSCYHHYYNDLFYRCNIKMLTNNGRYQSKNIKSNIKTKRKSNPKCLININNKNNKNVNNNISRSSSKNSINRSYIGVAKVCEENLEISYQIYGYLRQFCFYFQKNFDNLRLLIVIFLLALITSTVHSIDCQGKPQTKSISPIQPPLIKPPSPSLPLSIIAIGVISDTGTGATISLDSRYHISNTSNLRFDENFKSRICDKQGHIKNQHLNGHTKYSSQNTPNTDDQVVKNVSSNYQSHNPQLRHYNHDHHNSRHHHYHNQNERQNILNTLGDIQKKKYNFNTAVIRFENKFKNNNNNTVNNIAKQVADEDEENSGVVRKISELNINKFINHIRLNYNYKQNNKNNHNNSNNNNIIRSSNDTPSNDVKNAGYSEKVEAEKEDANETTNGLADVDYDDKFNYIDENDYVDDMFNLLPTITTPITTLDAATVNSTILQSITNVHQQLQPSARQQIPAQYDDHAKLMKLVMDGLGLKKPPNMKNFHIFLLIQSITIKQMIENYVAQRKHHI
ncbi:hypothetical protein DOY81_008483 [Sarcophaga bullata]|nr:hypothetical protein DOY81_008483 [Sarcophaga bullata]